MQVDECQLTIMAHVVAGTWLHNHTISMDCSCNEAVCSGMDCSCNEAVCSGIDCSCNEAMCSGMNCSCNEAATACLWPFSNVSQQ